MVSQIYTAINTPTYYYNDGWHSSNPDSWTRANYPISSTSKSIFDPCPYGYRVPTSNDNTKGKSDFFGFPTPPTWSANMINGMQFLSFWWPTSGGRNYGNATLYDIGANGCYYSASPNPTYNYSAYFFSLLYNGTTPVNYNRRSDGFSVRCVQE